MEVWAHHVIVANDVSEIKPFHLFHNPKEPHLDPVHALLCWIHVARIKEGYIFRRISTDDRIAAENKPLVWMSLGTTIVHLMLICRVRNFSLSFSAIIFWIYLWTSHPMVPIRLGMVVASIVNRETMGDQEAL
jgi:hypothetical protein